MEYTRFRVRAIGTLESVIWMTILSNVPLCVGVPEITPFGDRFSPGGRPAEADVSDQL